MRFIEAIYVLESVNWPEAPQGRRLCVSYRFGSPGVSIAWQKHCCCERKKRSIAEFSSAHTDTPTDHVSCVYLKGDMCTVSTQGQLAE